VITKETLKKIIFEQQELFNKIYIPRTKLLEIKKTKNNIIIITGIRRSGKSILIHQLREEKKEKDYYLNFDDERLHLFEIDDFEKLYETFMELFGKQKTFYFDEIQNIKGWELFIRRLHDYDNTIYITGSNANLLSKELGTHLTGRYTPLELYPASFEEFLTFKEYKREKNELYKREKIIIIIKYFNEYVEKGGFFKYLQTEDKEFFKTIYDNIIHKDILTRYSLTNEKGIKDIAHYLISNVAKQFSYTTLKKITNIASITTIKEYLTYLENTYLLFSISIYDQSLKKQYLNPKKVYCIDQGLAKQVSFRFSEDKGRILENIVFIELKRRGCEIYYHKEKKECDFVIYDKGKIVEALQVCYELDEDNKKREFEGLLEAMKKYKLKEGLLLTNDEEEEIILEGKKIHVIPVWKWLLSEGK
jgi:predicted AAA+ superfamily ATPase